MNTGPDQKTITSRYLLSAYEIAATSTEKHEFVSALREALDKGPGLTRVALPVLRKAFVDAHPLVRDEACLALSILLRKNPLIADHVLVAEITDAVIRSGPVSDTGKSLLQLSLSNCLCHVFHVNPANCDTAFSRVQSYADHDNKEFRDGAKDVADTIGIFRPELKSAIQALFDPERKLAARSSFYRAIERLRAVGSGPKR